MIVDRSLQLLKFSTAIFQKMQLPSPPQCSTSSGNTRQKPQGWERWVFSVHKELKEDSSTFQRKRQITFLCKKRKRVCLKSFSGIYGEVKGKSLGWGLGLKPKHTRVFIVSSLCRLGEGEVGIGAWKVGSRRKKKPSEGIYSFPFSHSPVSQNSRYGEKTDLRKRDREAGGKWEKLSTTGRRGLVLVLEMRAFLYKITDLHNTLLTWLRN